MILQAIVSIKGGEAFYPWGFNNYAPKWWEDYNNTKHNLPTGFKSGNIGNTIRALGALYSLHCMAYYIYHDENPLRVLKKENWEQDLGVATDMYDEIFEKRDDPRPRSVLFYNLSKFPKGVKF